MKIIASGNNKGGAGKTTNAIEITYGLHKRGYKVLLVDLDGQRNATIALGQKDANPTIYDALTGRTDIKETIISTTAGDLIPASANLDTLAQALTGDGREYTLKKALEPIAGDYDFIVLDLPPAINAASTNALAAADTLLIAAKAEAFHLEGVGALFQNVETIKRHCNNDLKIQGIIITQYRQALALNKAMYENAGRIAAQLGAKLYKPIRECTKVKEAQALHKSVYEYAPRCNAVKDYETLINDLLEDFKK